MTPGLKVVQLNGLYYGATFIAWVRRVEGDEYEMVAGARPLVRTGEYRSLAQLACDGPLKDHRVDPPSKLGEEIHRLTVRRVLKADENVWATFCPKPKDWADQ